MTQEYKYLGILISANGNVSKVKTDLSTRGQKAIFKMKSMFKNTNISYNTSMHLFDHIIKPVMLYGADIWGHTYLKFGQIDFNNINKDDDIEASHIKYCRSVLSVSKKAPNIGIYGETGRFPLAIDAVVSSIKYWLRIENLEGTQSLISNAYNEMQSIENCDNTFYHNMKYFVAKYNINNALSPKYICYKVRQALNENYIQYWKDKLFENPVKYGNKLRSYRTYKNTFQREEYLKLNSKQLRGEFARLRLSAHDLQIERGRYVKGDKRKEPEERLCTCCTLDECENEYHFAMICPLYNDLRNMLFTKIENAYPLFKEYSNKQKFIWLMSTLDLEILKEIAIYIKDCFVKRKCY